MRCVELLAVAAPLLAAACHSAPAAERVELGLVSDVLGGEGPLVELAGGLPAVFLVGPAEGADELLAARAALAESDPDAVTATVLDASALDARERVALEDRLVEAALDEGGAILVDEQGASARALAAGASRPLLVRLSGEGEVVARASADAAPEERAAVLPAGGRP